MDAPEPPREAELTYAPPAPAGHRCGVRKYGFRFGREYSVVRYLFVDRVVNLLQRGHELVDVVVQEEEELPDVRPRPSERRLCHHLPRGATTTQLDSMRCVGAAGGGRIFPPRDRMRTSKSAFSRSDIVTSSCASMAQPSAIPD